MKKLMLITSIALMSSLLYAQERGPAGNAGRSPAGGRSGPDKEVRGGGGNGNSGTGNGKTSVSKDAVTTANNIKASNSIDGKGKNMTEAQKNEAARQLDNARTQSAASGKKADADHFKKESDLLKKN